MELLHRDQEPAAADPGITESFDLIAKVHADVQDTTAQTFYGGVQVDTPITHRIFIRWRGDLDTNCVVRRTQRTPDGVWRTLLYRIRRTKLWDGRTRFLELECELENVASDTP